MARHVRQQILGDLLNDLSDRRNASDVREALIDAAKRCETMFSHFRATLHSCLTASTNWEAKFQSYDEEEKNAIIRAVQALQTHH